MSDQEPTPKGAVVDKTRLWDAIKDSIRGKLLGKKTTSIQLEGMGETKKQPVAVDMLLLEEDEDTRLILKKTLPTRLTSNQTEPTLAVRGAGVNSLEGALAEFSPKVVLVGISQPEDVDIIRGLRMSGKLRPETTVIGLTFAAGSELEEAQKMFESKGVRLLGKPIRPDKLAETLTPVLNR